ncbi:MAG: pyridoxal-phosphate dependent enzyme [Myxococcales bacterium]|nr:pyridoxal-phosphate dependent enzyme [Myxococcales bacterium]
MRHLFQRGFSLEWILPNAAIRIEEPPSLGVRVLRDDLLHPFASGNKVRKLDGLLPRFRSGGVSDVVTCGGLQSAHTAAVAVLCAQLGMRAHLVLRGPEMGEPTGNLLISKLFGQVTLVDRDTYSDREAAMDVVAEPLRLAGGTVAVVPEGGLSAGGMEGLVRLVEGLARALPDASHTLVVDAGTGATALGLAIGILTYGLPWRVRAVELMKPGSYDYRSKVECAFDAYRAEHRGPQLEAELPIDWVPRATPRRFGKILPGEMESCAQLARQSGVLFDPIFTLPALEEARRTPEGLLIHTGGSMNIFSLAQRVGQGFLDT